MVQALHAMMGVDLTAIPTIGVGTALTIAAEVGLDMSAFPTARHSDRGWGGGGNPDRRRKVPAGVLAQGLAASWRWWCPWPP